MDRSTFSIANSMGGSTPNILRREPESGLNKMLREGRRKIEQELEHYKKVDDE